MIRLNAGGLNFTVEDLKGHKPYGLLSNIVQMESFGRITVNGNNYSNLPDLMDALPDPIVDDMIRAMNEYLQIEHDRTNRFNRHG